jgi:hypothetical protein
MTPTILDSDYATRIRSRLGVTESVLSTVEIDEKLPDLEDHYSDILPTWASLTAKKSRYFKSSLVSMTASALCPVVKAKYSTRITGPDGSRERPINWDVRKKELESEANGLLSQCMTVTIYSHFQIK